MQCVLVSPPLRLCVSPCFCCCCYVCPGIQPQNSMSAHAGQWRRPRTPSYSTVPVINQSPRFCFSFERSFSYHQMQKTYACLWKSCRCVTVEPKHLSRGSPQHSALLQSPQHDGARWFLPFVDDCPLCGLLGLGVTECGLGIRLLSGHMMFSDSFILPYSF